MPGNQRGAFPFGRPNDVRPMRPAGRKAKALVVGVYPSAFHVAWTPPAGVELPVPLRPGRAYIGSFAVDVEPVVFWDGRDPAPADLLGAWRDAVGFDEDRHGTVTVGANGPSGAGLLRNTLAPLEVGAEDTAFTDALPWFFIKSGHGSQADATAKRFAPIAAQLGLHPGSLPSRPPPAKLVALAASEDRRTTLRAEIVEADAPLVITLGQEALDAVRAVADACRGVQEQLRPKGYGQQGELVVEGRAFDFLPLAHPGFERQTTRPEWTAAFDLWRERATPPAS